MMLFPQFCGTEYLHTYKPECENLKVTGAHPKATVDSTSCLTGSLCRSRKRLHQRGSVRGKHGQNRHGSWIA